jgi:hypothetical protein
VPPDVASRDKSGERSDGQGSADQVEASPEPTKPLGVGRDDSLLASAELAIDWLGEENRADEDHCEQPDPAQGERSRGSVGEKGERAGPVPQMTSRIGSAGSALRRERRKSTAYARSSSRRQIQTRSHAAGRISDPDAFSGCTTLQARMCASTSRGECGA